MLQKVPQSAVFNRAGILPPERMNAAMRGLCKCSVIDPGDKILDLNCENGALLMALQKKTDCILCGITPYVEKSRHARVLLPDADILYGFDEDIPWHDESFDVILSSRAIGEMENASITLNEAYRVLKPGGQFLIAVPWYPTPIRQIINHFSSKSTEYQTKESVFRTLKELHFEDLSWHVTEFGMAVAVAWKKRKIKDIPE